MRKMTRYFSANPSEPDRRLTPHECRQHMQEMDTWHHVHVDNDGRVYAYAPGNFKIDGLYIYEKDELCLH